jgi:hypothetical protein
VKLLLVLVAVVLVAGQVVVLAPVASSAMVRSRHVVCVRAGAPCVSWWHPHDRTRWVR